MRKIRRQNPFVLLFAILTAVCCLTACGTDPVETVSREAESRSESHLESILPSQTEASPIAETETKAESDEEPNIKSEAETQSKQEEAKEMLKIEIGSTVFTATFADNSSVDAFKALLQGGPLILQMRDYGGMEKVAELDTSLPQNNEPMHTQAGDIILYQGRTFSIYYDTNSWSLTPIGKIDGADAATLREVLGSGDVTVTLSLVRG